MSPANGTTARPEIIRLGPEAIPAVRRLWAQAGLLFRPEGRDSEETFARELETTGTFLLGAFEGDELVGVALGTDDGRKGWINRVAVRPDRRRSGLGRRLIRACEQILAERGIGLVACLVEEGNQASLDLFAGEGYEIRRDVVYLRKPLAGEDW